MVAGLRRVVTAVDSSGRSSVSEDVLAPRSYELQTLGGLTATAIWEVPAPLHDVTAGGDPAGPLTLQPPTGAVRFFRIVIPPQSAASQNPDEILAEINERLPSFLEVVDPERELGMHRTDTLDLSYVVSGELDLVLETGTVSLRPGDAIVQRGTWHAWSNPHEEPCVMIVAMLRRTPQTSD
jgi:mannose-6-phosphate isomerase-like protein (cupin superfamily)